MIDTKLKTFICVVEKKNYTKAAYQLHLSQPAISQHIKQLEMHYGYKLIDHTSKTFSLTKEGEKLYTYAKVQIQNEILFENELKNKKQKFRIGATLSIADYYLYRSIHESLIEKHNIHIEVSNTSKLTKRLIEGSVQCAFVEGNFDPHIFTSHLYLEEEMVALVHKDHPLLQKYCKLQDVFEYPILVREKGSGTREVLETHLALSYFNLDNFVQQYEIGSLTLIKHLLSYKHAVTFLYKNVVDTWDDSLVVLPIRDFKITHPMHFIYLKNSIHSHVYYQLFNEMKFNKGGNSNGKHKTEK